MTYVKRTVNGQTKIDRAHDCGTPRSGTHLVLSELVLYLITQIQIKVSNTKNEAMSSTTSAGNQNH